jgi:hypothetical protein
VPQPKEIIEACMKDMEEAFSEIDEEMINKFKEFSSPLIKNYGAEGAL